jgi:limonene-1,2-epoxide hydrolase
MVQAFRQAVEAGDLDAVVAQLRDDVVFHSPVVFQPYQGREAVRPILAAVIEVFEDFRYVREIGAAETRDHALVFTARVGDKEIEGCDFVRLDEAGAIKELTVMVRPLSAMLTLAEMMKTRLTAM